MTNATVSDSLADEAAPWSASIIPFPMRPRPAEPAPEERLARALASLNEALAEQRIAVATWRAALGDLKETTNGLQDSLQRYRTNLGSLGDSVSALRDKACALEQWADGAGAAVD
ncbi:MAG: hypothetical protein QOH05_3664 [Acetobacteraceae bacterium]|nr:hypothetical protein [Acetobacteraceae bacterium]